MDLHVFPISIPPPTSLSTRSLWVFPVYQARALISCIQPGLVICFTLDNIHVSMLFSRNIPPLPSPTGSKSLFCTCVPHPEPASHLLPHPISQGHPSAPALSSLSYASNLDWWSISHMVIYVFQCYSLKSSHPRLLPQSPKVCSLHLCLFCCLALLPYF